MASKKKQNVQSQYGDAPYTLTDRPFYGFTLDDDQAHFRDEIWSKDKDIIFCNASAGSGKTFIATGVANLLVNYGLYDGIVYIVSSYGERKQGYLPGDIQQKSEVYFEPFYQALIDCGVNPDTSINNESMINQKNGTGYITCLTHTYLRGTNLSGKVVIIDEAQNFTLPDLKKTLTRIHDNCKVIVIGHDKQCDLDKRSESGFLKYIRHFADEARAAICELTCNYRGWISRKADELEY